MNKRTKSFLLSILTFSFIFYSCSNLANDLQKRKNQNLFNITIQECQNGTVTVTKSSGIKAGEEVILSVTATTGYELKTISVTNTQNKDVAVAAMEHGTSYKFTMPASDVTVGAAFDKTGPVDITEPGDLNNSSGDTVYKIEHCQQSLTDTGIYDLVAIQYKRGNAGDQTTAVSSTFPGFTALSFDQQTINSNGNTIVRIYYDRNIITYTFDPNGGNWEGSTEPMILSGPYGAKVNKTDPKKPGYSFVWSTIVPECFGLENVTFTANWTANKNTPYTVRIYLQNVEGDDNYTFNREITKTGTTDTNTNYSDTKYGFKLQPVEQQNINGDGSTILNVYYKRLYYTVTFNTMGGSHITRQEVLYQARVQLPLDPTKTGYSFYKWYTDQDFNNAFDIDSEITADTTLYAFWIDNSITYKFHETVERLTAGTNGTMGTTGEYVLFGDYPQSFLENTVTVDENKTIKMGNTTVYGGSDGCLYYKYSGSYFKIEPIKWRVISRDENNIVVLLAENILDISKFNSYYRNFIYTNSLIQNFLNTHFLSEAFTVSAQNYIEITTIDSDSTTYSDNGEEQYLYYSEDKIYLLKYSELFNSSAFPDSSSRKRTLTGFSACKIRDEFQGESWMWWLLSSFFYIESPDYFSDYDFYGVYIVDNNGDYNLQMSDYNEGGVVPALSIYLPPAD